MPIRDEDAATERALAVRMARLLRAALDGGAEARIVADILRLRTTLLATHAISWCALRALNEFFSLYEVGGWLTQDLKYVQEHYHEELVTSLTAIFHMPKLSRMLGEVIEYTDEATTFTGIMRAGELLARWRKQDPQCVLVEPAIRYFETLVAKAADIGVDDIISSVDRVLSTLQQNGARVSRRA